MPLRMAEFPSLSREREEEQPVIDLLNDPVCRLKMLPGVGSASATPVLEMRAAHKLSYDNLLRVAPAVAPSQWVQWMWEGRVIPDLMRPLWSYPRRIPVRPEEGQTELKSLRYNMRAPTGDDRTSSRYGTNALTANEFAQRTTTK